jgi:hypothetical protein
VKSRPPAEKIYVALREFINFVSTSRKDIHESTVPEDHPAVWRYLFKADGAPALLLLT